MTAIINSTALFMVTIVVSLLVSWVLTRKMPKMTIITAVVILVFGGLTIYLEDETFIKMKPSIVNALFAIVLGFGLLRGKSYLQTVMAQGMPLTQQGWMIMTKLWMVFFALMAILNEIVWRTQSTETWVDVKTFGYLPITLVFTFAQLPFLKKYMKQED